MEQLENKTTEKSVKTEKQTSSRSRRTSKPKNQAAVGVASTFDSKELKTFFVNYLTTMLVIEGLIFFFCFVNHLATGSDVFPWKPYLFATFITPIAITFVFGLIILTFNKYFFKNAVDDPPEGPFAGISVNKGDRLATFFQVVHRLPFLLSLLLLIAATAIAYKMDAIVLFAAQAGATTAQYLFFTLVGILVAIALGIASWMILSYRLRHKTLTTDHQYKMQLMEQFGMVMMDDGTMLNKNGEIVYQQDVAEQIGYSEGNGEVKLIEEVKDDK